jgi:hypothetical protein
MFSCSFRRNTQFVYRYSLQTIFWYRGKWMNKWIYLFCTWFCRFCIIMFKVTLLEVEFLAWKMFNVYLGIKKSSDRVGRTAILCVRLVFSREHGVLRSLQWSLCNNHATLQCNNHATLQPCNALNFATQHSRNLATQQSRNLATQQSRNFATQQSRNLATQQWRNLATQQSRNLAMQQSRNLAKIRIVMLFLIC